MTPTFSDESNRSQIAIVIAALKVIQYIGIHYALYEFTSYLLTYALRVSLVCLGVVPSAAASYLPPSVFSLVSRSRRKTFCLS